MISEKEKGFDIICANTEQELWRTRESETMEALYDNFRPHKVDLLEKLEANGERTRLWRIREGV